ncbi:MAG: tetratricopeptide repeat protein [Halopseudomonas sp.]|uniref:tetratricopeptide repeat protein n=1 Tax=Halopseudomonas sp. TaxID=2901191 RepID=UPI003003A1F9
MATTENSLRLHLGIAEQGKLLALKGRHQDALQHYREALRLAVSSGAPEVFFRHYTQCVMESLELSGELDSVLRYCDEAEQHYQRLASPLPLVSRDRAENLQRRGCVLLRQGRLDAAMASLEQALQLAAQQPLPLARELTGWSKRGLTVGVRQLGDAQHRHQYFIVRKALVDPARAIPLPPERLQRARAAIPF